MGDQSTGHVAQLEQSLVAAQLSLTRNKSISRSLRRYGILLAAGVVGFWGGAAYAQTSIKAVAANDPLTKLSQRMDAMEQRLQARINSLEGRVRQLENKSNLINSSPSPGQNNGAPNSGHPTASNSGATGGLPGMHPSGNLKGVPSQTFSVPFVIKDHQGHTLLLVDDRPGERGLFLFDSDNHPVVVMGTPNSQGGILQVQGSADQKNSVILGVLDDRGPRLRILVDGKEKILLGSEGSDSTYVYLMGDTAVPVVGMQTSSRHTGEMDVFNSSGNPIATLAQGNDGGKLELSDASAALMVDAGTLPTHVGIVRTGPASRAPGGLMGVPGSYITGKGD
jgi:hypothetical protein